MLKMKTTTLIIIITILLTIRLFGQVDRVFVNINDTVQLSLERTKFDTTGKKYEYYDNKFPFSINERPIFGTDGDFPKYTLTKATLTIGSNKYDLQVDNMYNPWFGDRPNDNAYKIKKDGTEILLIGFFSDGAGYYGAEWLIVGRSSVRTILTKDELLLFAYLDDKK